MNPDNHIYEPWAVQIPTDVKSAMTTAEALELAALARNKRVLEFGSLLGFSTIVMAQQALSVTAVDPHTDYPAPGAPSTLPAFARNIKRYGLEPKVCVIPKRYQDVNWAKLGGLWDMAFIDCSEEATPMYQLCRCLGIPTVAVHDYGIPKWTGATKLVGRLASEGLQARVVDTLAIYER